MSLPQATMLVAGNMIGTGVFLLPVNLAQVGGIAIFGWVIATLGVAALGLVFAKLGELNPQQGGPYAYARDFLGPYAGFQTNYVYWFGNWIGNIAIAVAAVGYLSELAPVDRRAAGERLATAVVIWLLTFANILGPRVVGALETWTMALALDPDPRDRAARLVLVRLRDVPRGLERERRLRPARRLARRVDGAVGLHGHRERDGLGGRDREPDAQRAARDADRPRARGGRVRAELHRDHGHAAERASCRRPHAPFADAARLALGAAGAIVISVCAVLKSVGSLGGWMLLVGQSAKAAADDGMFPRVFARLNRARRARRRAADHRRRC